MQVMTPKDYLYPRSLFRLKNFPQKLYYRGNINLLVGDNLISVVGSRKPTSYTREILINTLSKVVEAGLVSVSGLGYGVDTIIHQISLDCDKPTIAILPWGINFVPESVGYLGLLDNIVKGSGLLLSEFPPDAHPQKWMFISRNRIIATLSKVLVVVQAGSTGGSITTANIGLKNDVKVFTPLVPMFDPNYDGNITILKRGGFFFSSERDLLDAYLL